MFFFNWFRREKTSTPEQVSPPAGWPPPPPRPSSSGRWFRRSGASVQGTLSNWIAHLVSRRISEAERAKIANRAWDLYLNDAMAHGIIEGMVTEVIGTGLTPQAQPMIQWLDLDVEWQQRFQQRIYDLFEIWGLDPRNFCDATGRQNIYMLQALALFYWKLDGIGLFQVIRSEKPGRPFFLRLLPIDPSRLITPTDLKSDTEVYDGLELDSEGAVKSAYILKRDNRLAGRVMATSAECTKIPVTDPRTGLPNLLLVCDVRNIAEYRQDSVLGSVIKEIRDNCDFVDAALVKALISNLFAVFIEDTFGQQGAAPTAINWQDRIQELEKGTLIIGRPGEKPTPISSDAPGPNFDIMFQSIIKRLGMSTCRGPENISREYKASYSASQASLENAAKFDDTDRQVIVNRFCQPALMWLEYEAVMRRMLPVESIDAFVSNLHAYSRARWLPPPLRPIDKNKAANADKTRLETHTRTYSEIYGEKSEDWRVGLRQAAIERAYIKELEEEYGIDLSPKPSVPVQDAAPPEPPPTKEDIEDE